MRDEKMGAMDIVVRVGQPEDVQTVLAIWREAGATPTRTDSVAAVSALLEANAAALLIAEVDGGIVGTLIAAWDGWRGNFYRLAVLSAYRRRGVGRALVREGERRLRDQGAIRMSALVIDGHDDAVGFWRAAGYHWDEKVLRFVKTHPG